MASWKDVVAASPEFAVRVQDRFDAGKHKTLATLRKDGSPRISGIEAQFVDGELWFGSMWRGIKALDLQRDPRFSLHSPTGDDNPESWKGDAKISGRVEEITDPARAAAVAAATGGEQSGEQSSEPSHLFRAEIAEIVLTRLGDPADHLVIELWTESRGLERIERW